MLRLAARWGDAFNTWWHTDPSALERPFAALDTACQEVGRDPATLPRTIGTFVSLDDHPERAAGRVASEGLHGTPDQIADGLRALAAAGAQHITSTLSPPFSPGGRVVKAEMPRPNTGNPSSRISTRSVSMPSTTAPATPRTCAATDTPPPQQA